MSKVIELTEKTFKDEVSEGVTLVDFWAPWCGPCRMIAPVIEELSEDYEGKAKICKVNVDEEQNLAVQNHVRSIPHILIMKNGEVVDQMIGAGSKDDLKQKINAALG